MGHKIGAAVMAICSLEENGLEICRPGDRGRVVHLEPDGVPLVRFERTGRASIVDGDTEVVSARTTARACA